MSRFSHLVKQLKQSNCKRRTFRTRCLIAITGKAHEKPLVVHDKILTVLVAFTTDGGSPRLALGLSAPDSSHVEIQIWDPIARRQTGLLTGHTNRVY